MSKIKDALKNKPALIGFLTGGHPDLDTSKKLICAIEEAGVDILEIGIPFSDPIAEGPIIQAADLKALSSGCRIDDIFDLVKEVRKTVKIPLVFKTYLNPIYVYGKKKFFKKCKKAGIDGIVICDIPYEEMDELYSECEEYGIELLSTIVTKASDRICTIAKEAKGFLYCLPSFDATQVCEETTKQIKEAVELVKSVSNIPCAVAYDISTPEEAKELAKVADAVIVESAIVKVVSQNGKHSVEPLKEYVSSLKKAITSDK